MADAPLGAPAEINGAAQDLIGIASQDASGVHLAQGVLGSVDAVSYTHLDVYKRQALRLLRQNRRGHQKGRQCAGQRLSLIHISLMHQVTVQPRAACCCLIHRIK